MQAENQMKQSLELVERGVVAMEAHDQNHGRHRAVS